MCFKMNLNHCCLLFRDFHFFHFWSAHIIDQCLRRNFGYFHFWQRTVVSDRKPIVGLRYPYTIGNYILAKISLTVAKNIPRMLEYAFCINTTVNSQKVQKYKLTHIYEEIFLYKIIYAFSRSRAFRKCNWLLRAFVQMLQGENRHFVKIIL